MFDRPNRGEKAVLVHQQSGVPDPDALQEFIELSGSAGAEVADIFVINRQFTSSRLYIGSGKADEIQQFIQAECVELVIFNHELSPSQERNLEAEFKCRVVDRTGLILDIFAQRARSFEGKLQVELAQLRHLSTRLIRGWTHLERQKGGIGLRGPGETQLESDRRLLNQRILQIKKRLHKVSSQRDQGRKARVRAEIPTVSLVGYTNTGKSTLFNGLTESKVYAANQLFATLDPTLRRLDVSLHQSVVLADTVGFVSDLPHDLVAAFKSTLQETVNADLLLHVIDAASQQKARCVEEVHQVLGHIGAGDVMQLEIYNKIDLLDGVEPRIDYDQDKRPIRVWVSAQENKGLELVRQAINELFFADKLCLNFQLLPADGRLRALLFAKGRVVEEQMDEQGCVLLCVEFAKTSWAKLSHHEMVLLDKVVE